MDKGGFVYMLANRRQGALYTGVTSDLMKRISEHRMGLLPGFTLEHDIKRLMWSEAFGDIELAIQREKRIKKWNRAWKIRLIEAANPHWHDLAVTDLGFPPLISRHSRDGGGPSPDISASADGAGDGPPPSRG